jgi:hypothetical protein
MQRDFFSYVECQVECGGEIREVLIPDCFACVGFPWRVTISSSKSPSKEFNPKEWKEGKVITVGRVVPSEEIPLKEKDRILQPLLERRGLDKRDSKGRILAKKPKKEKK